MLQKSCPRHLFTFTSLVSQVTILSLLLNLKTIQSWSPKSNNNNNNHQHKRLQRKLLLSDGSRIDIISRTIPITTTWNITIWEQDQPAEIVEQYWDSQTHSLPSILDPFGLVTWPGSVVAAQQLLRYSTDYDMKQSTVVVLGAGTGLEAQAVAMLGARKVIATDIHPTTLELLQYGVEQAGLSHTIQTQYLDLFGTIPIPPCDLLLAADVLYSPKLAMQVGERIRQVLQWKQPPKVLVTDSQRFQGTDFCPDLRNALADDSFGWEELQLEQFTGSGVMLNEDQTYNVKVRVLAIGFDKGCSSENQNTH